MKTMLAVFAPAYRDELPFFSRVDRKGKSIMTPASRVMVDAESGVLTGGVCGMGTCWPKGDEAQGEGGFASEAFALPNTGGRSD